MPSFGSFSHCRRVVPSWAPYEPEVDSGSRRPRHDQCSQFCKQSSTVRRFPIGRRAACGPSDAPRPSTSLPRNPDCGGCGHADRVVASGTAPRGSSPICPRCDASRGREGDVRPGRIRVFLALDLVGDELIRLVPGNAHVAGLAAVFADCARRLDRNRRRFIG